MKFAFSGLLLLVLLVTRQTWSDPPYWDSFCYVDQARFIAGHGLDLAAYRALPFVRPPLYTGLLALVVAHASASIRALHVVTATIGFLVLPAVFALVRQLGGTGRAAVVAVALVFASPIYIAQAGLLQSDLLATALCTLAWVLLLRGWTLAFALCAALSVLTKESTYFLCAPAFALLVMRALQDPRSGGPQPVWPPPWRRILTRRVLVAAWPALVPGLVLIGWLYCHKLLVGVAVPRAHSVSVGFNFLPDALLHNLFEGGRILLVLLAAALLRALPSGLYREARSAAVIDRIGVYATAGAALVLPLFFPAPLPRYMVLTLPLFAALAALWLDTQEQQRRYGLLALTLLLMVLGWRGRSWHTDGGHHLDANLAYRAVLAAETQAARELAAAVPRPRSVLSTFPMYLALLAPPEYGILQAPVRAALPDPARDTDASLCAHDYLIEAAQGNSIAPALDLLRRLGALSLWRSFGEPGQEIRVYRIQCPRTSG